MHYNSYLDSSKRFYEYVNKYISYCEPPKSNVSNNEKLVLYYNTGYIYEQLLSYMVVKLTNPLNRNIYSLNDTSKGIYFKKRANIFSYSLILNEHSLKSKKQYLESHYTTSLSWLGSFPNCLSTLIDRWSPNVRYIYPGWFNSVTFDDIKKMYKFSDKLYSDISNI